MTATLLSSDLSFPRSPDRAKTWSIIQKDGNVVLNDFSKKERKFLILPGLRDKSMFSSYLDMRLGDLAAELLATN
jgi:hypothetical protein